MAAGRPTIVSPGVMLAPLISAANAGVVVSNDPHELATAIATLLTDEGKRIELGSRARDFARQFDWMEIADDIERAFYATTSTKSHP